jgi:hypothetical protein
MRLSCRRDDPGFDEEAIVKDYTFRLNGKVIEFVVTIDTDEGFVTFYEQDENGEPKRNEAGTDLVEKTVYGKVEIEE